VCYNISGIEPPPTAKELEIAIKKIIPSAQINYKPDPLVVQFVQSVKVKQVNDRRASEEWGWRPQYTKYEDVVADFVKEVKERPEYYGLI